MEREEERVSSALVPVEILQGIGIPLDGPGDVVATLRIMKLGRPPLYLFFPTTKN